MAANPEQPPAPAVDARKTLLLLAFASALPAVGGTIAMPDSPAPAFADLESVTNAPIRTSTLQRARLFEGSVSLFATPPDWMFSRDWNTVRLTIRGADDPAEAVTVKFNTDPVNRCFVSASGSVSFDSMRRPPIGIALPDGTGLPVLCPLRAPLGMVPEARWSMVFGQDEQDSPALGDGSVPVNPENPANPVKGSRFWHDALPGGGRVLTWENALVDRLPGRRVSLQVEMRPTGDSAFRYAFQDELDPPPTNFVMGAQMGTNGVNALSILGTNTLAATVWNVDGAPVTNGVSIADLLCTNGVLRTPSAFEIRWKNTTGLDPEADTDNDGLTDWAETFQWGTDPNHGDTDGDGKDDGTEIAWGDDPFDADENSDGVPDGMSEAAWTGHPLWAVNSTNDANVVVSLNEAVPQGSSATLILGDLVIPLRNPASWPISLIPGQMYDFRLQTKDNVPVDITLSPPAAQPLRSGGQLRSPPDSDEEEESPLWQKPKDSLAGPTGNTSGKIAVPELSLEWVDPEDGSHETDTVAGVCLHSESGSAMFRAVIRPNGTGVTEQDLVCEGMGGSGTLFGLFVPAEPAATAVGAVSFARSDLRWGRVTARAAAHRAGLMIGGGHCAICDAAGVHVDDVSLHVRSPLTLKHDNMATVSFHCEQTGHGTATDPEIRIRRVGTTEWSLLAESFQYEWTARVAGFFELTATADVDGTSVEAGPVMVEVRFPSYGEIASDPDVLDFTEDIWTDTKNAHYKDDQGVVHSQEFACWIYLDTEQNEYFRGPIAPGITTVDGEQGGTWVGCRPDDMPVLPSPIADGTIYPVCHFHTHTPMTFRSFSRSRPVGPSPEDIGFCNSNSVPGMLYDYAPDGRFLPKRLVPGGHSKDSAAYREHFGTFDRRPTP